MLDGAVAAAQESGVKKVKGEPTVGALRPTCWWTSPRSATSDWWWSAVVAARPRSVRPPTGSHRAPRDLLIAMDVERGDGEHLYRRILIATDGSATADRAARKGFDLAASVGASATLVFVGHPATGKLVTDDTVAVFGAEVDCDVVLRQGDPADEILAVAREVRADLIVIGNKGMTGAKRFFLNPVPEKVVDMSDRDVLVARTIAQVASELEPGEGGIGAGGGAARRIHGRDGGAASDVRALHAYGPHGRLEHGRPRLRVSLPRVPLRPSR